MNDEGVEGRIHGWNVDVDGGEGQGKTDTPCVVYLIKTAPSCPVSFSGTVTRERWRLDLFPALDSEQQQAIQRTRNEALQGLEISFTTEDRGTLRVVTAKPSLAAATLEVCWALGAAIRGTKLLASDETLLRTAPPAPGCSRLLALSMRSHE